MIHPADCWWCDRRWPLVAQFREDGGRRQGNWRGWHPHPTFPGTAAEAYFLHRFYDHILDDEVRSWVARLVDGGKLVGR